MSAEVIIGVLYIKQSKTAGIKRLGLDDKEEVAYPDGYHRRHYAVYHSLYYERPAYIPGSGTEQTHYPKLISSVEYSHLNSVEDNKHGYDREDYDPYEYGFSEKCRSMSNLVYRFLTIS